MQPNPDPTADERRGVTPCDMEEPVLGIGDFSDVR
jgi:hypothetical protein